MGVLDAPIAMVRHMQPRCITGTVSALRGLSVLVDDLPLPIGALVRLVPRAPRVPRPRAAVGSHRALRLRIDESADSDMFSETALPHAAVAPALRGEVVGFDGPSSIVMLFGDAVGISPGTRVIGEQSQQTVQVGRSLLGRVIDGLGRPIDGGRTPLDLVARPLHPPPVGALKRRAIDEPLPTGVASIDAMVTIGKGQRVGIFSAAGVGKSTLLASVARNTTADVNVIALVGERGREVREFLEQALGEEGRKRSVVVVATGDESPLLRVRAAKVACSVAEHFGDLGADVMLMMDSVTRFAQAQRQIGLTVGEQPATKGYTPSVFAMLPVLLERAGAVEGAGSITGLYAVLVEGDDMNEPVSDAARGVLDGHISLSRKLAARGHYPAVDALESISRVADLVCDANHVESRQLLRRLLAAHRDSEELINIGAYARGSNPYCDIAITLHDEMDRLLCQPPDEHRIYPQTCRALVELAQRARDMLAAARRDRSSGHAAASPPSEAANG